MQGADLDSAARSRLALGEAPGSVFASLVSCGVDPRAAAIAVCAAGGTSRFVAEERLREYDELWPLLEPGDEAAAGDLLEIHGCFDHEPILDEEQTHVLHLLHGAMATIHGWPSGYAISLSRRLRQAQFAEAVIHMESIGAQRWPTNRDYWIKLSQAADAISAHGDEHFIETRARCRLRALGQET